jgi:hypothetical protein
VLYATFDPGIPRVFLGRQALSTDAGGHFDATISVAPAFFTGTVITVIVQTTAAVSVAESAPFTYRSTGDYPK